MSTTAVSLSVVVPVHQAQGHLRQCLESVLTSASPDLEVVAVAEPAAHGSRLILDEYAERDPRLRVRYEDGVARDAGLDLATGEYVWILDADDYAAEGAVEAVLDRLAQTRPDVLVINYAHVTWDGRIRRNTFAEGADPVTLAADGNAVYRREHLRALGVRFGPGRYPDLSVIVPAVLAARQGDLLDRTCYLDRQPRKPDRTGHFDVFPQYERVFAAVDARFRPAQVDRMVTHLLGVLDEVPAADRPAFFAAISDAYRRFGPGQATPDPAVQQGDYQGFERQRKIGGLKREARTRVRRSRKLARRTLAKNKKRAKLLYYRARRAQPIDENLVIYGAYWYRGYSCNPRAIYEKARELAPQLRGVWVVRPGIRVPKGVEHVVQGSKAYYDVVARAKYLVNNVNYPDHVVKRPGQIHVQTHHGTPLKTMGLDQMGHPAGGGDNDFEAMMARSDRWDYVVSSNPLSTEAWQRGFPCDYEMLEIGYPRNDRFFHYTPDEVARLRTELGIPEGRKAILYAPTHRDYQEGFHPMFDIAGLMRRLGPEYVLLLRAHYFYASGETFLPDGQVIDVSDHPSVEDLCLASDALLTDYSSVMFDYACLGSERPIVIYANDWDTYVRTRGVNFDLLAGPPGVVATTEDELATAFITGAPWGDAAAKQRADFRARFCCWDDGNAAERVVRKVFLGQKVPQGAELTS
jgi:CDP-glycerol glycerophosphotransferase